MFKLAWRNIWRNRRRAILTMASIFFAVFISVIETCYSTGVFEKMLDNMLKTQGAHIQIHGKDYWDDKIIDNFMFMGSATISEIEQIDNVENVSPRVETFAMASFETTNKGIAIIGISPEKEAKKSKLPSRLVSGNYLTETDDGILIGEGLSKYLKSGIGDTLALIGQGYQGASAAQLFVVRGIANFMIPQMNNSAAYITLQAAQQFIDMPDGYSGVLVSLKDNKQLDKTMEVISRKLSVVSDENYAVYPWTFTMEYILKTIESNNVFDGFILAILYLIVGFGILSTVIMMSNERKREFCVMISLGMSRKRLFSVVCIELFIMSLAGVALAIITTIPMAHWFHEHPIQMSGEVAKTYLQFGMEPLLPMSVEPSIFIKQVIIVLVISLLTMIYPIVKVLKLKITTK